MNDNIKSIGAELAEYAKDAEFTAQRGLVVELFPYIWLASRRMSIRAICRWLLAERGIKISVESVARSMRDPAKYWRAVVENVEPAARIFADAHGITPADVLGDETCFQVYESKPPAIAGNTDEERGRALVEYDNAVATINADWFAYPAEARTEGRRYVWSALGAESEGGEDDED